MIIEVRADESRVISFVPPSRRDGFVFAKSFMHLGFTHQSNKLMFGDTLTAKQQLGGSLNGRLLGKSVSIQRTNNLSHCCPNPIST